MIVSQPSEQVLGSSTQLASALFMAGLIVAIISLVWTSPLAMLAFVTLAALLFGASVGMFIWRFVAMPRRDARALANDSGD